MRGADAERDFTLAQIYCRLNDYETAIACARRVPDRPEEPNQLSALLAVVPEPYGDEAFGPRIPYGDEKTPGVPTRFYFDRVSCLKALDAVMAIVPLIAIALYWMPRRSIMGPFSLLWIILAGWCYLRIDRLDRFPIGERFFSRGNFRPAARVFSHLAKFGDPRSLKRLGDMHAEGLGLEKEPETALTAYRLALASMQSLREVWDDPALRSFFRFRLPGFNNNPQALAEWYEDIKNGLEKLGKVGLASAYDLLADLSAMLGETACARLYAEQIYAISPSSDRELRLADARLRSADAPQLVEEGMRSLQQCLKAGDALAASILLRRAAEEASPNAEKRVQALAWYQVLRIAALAEYPETDDTLLMALRTHSRALLRAFGVDFLDDNTIASVARLHS